jgi:tRNA-splicing ligase RtcB
MAQYFITLEDPNLAYFVEGTDEFADYMRDLTWAQDYALANRESMMDRLLNAIRNAVGKPYQELERINCHHNYTALEHHMGRNLYITRKGAIRARVGDRGVIPGSMGTNSFIVTGTGNPASYQSSAHGAGRAMSRRQAKDQFTEEDLEAAMAGKTWNQGTGRALVDEIPGAYKDIHRVMEDQADLVEVTHELNQILNYKGV